jgi:YHS domain-containing protein
MKSILIAIALAAAGTALALQEDDRAPVNKTCPVQKGKAINRAFMSVYENRPIAFCCEKCKKLFDDDPSEYAGKLPATEAPKAPGFAQLGRPAPPFELRDTDGSLVKLADFKDQIVVL